MSAARITIFVVATHNASEFSVPSTYDIFRKAAISLLHMCAFWLVFAPSVLGAQSTLTTEVANGDVTETSRLNDTAEQFRAELHLVGFSFLDNLPKIVVETTPAICMYSVRDNVVRIARYSEVSRQDRDVFDRQAVLSHHYSSGEDFFNQSFYRFFFVHELGHWVSLRVALARQDSGWSEARKQMRFHVWQQEREANRISVAYGREHDPKYLATLIGGFRSILERWPNPVPQGKDISEYFNGDFQEKSPDAKTFSWFQLTSAVQAYDETPRRTLQELVRALPNENYGITVKP